MGIGVNNSFIRSKFVVPFCFELRLTTGCIQSGTARAEKKLHGNAYRCNNMEKNGA
jgi:hypothetical protein